MAKPTTLKINPITHEINKIIPITIKTFLIAVFSNFLTHLLRLLTFNSKYKSKCGYFYDAYKKIITFDQIIP